MSCPPIRHLDRISKGDWRRLAGIGLLISPLLAITAAYAANIALSENRSLAKAIRSAKGDDQVASVAADGPSGKG